MGDLMNNLKACDIDYYEGIKYCCDEEFYIEVLGYAVEAYPEKIKALKRSLADKDIKSYTVTMHSIKSNCKNIGADKLAQLAYELEMAGKREDVNYIEKNAERFTHYYNEIMTNIAKILQNL